MLIRPGVPIKRGRGDPWRGERRPKESFLYVGTSVGGKNFTDDEVQHQEEVSHWNGRGELLHL